MTLPGTVTGGLRYVVRPSDIRHAAVTVPGDKSISHRALMLGSIAEGRTTVRGFLAGEDCLATMAAMRALGVPMKRHGETEISIEGAGPGGLEAPAGPLDLGNSGTAMRLMTGLLCAQVFDSTLTGDASLRSRPMQRVIDPLSAMGAKINSKGGRPPLRIQGSPGIHAIDYALPVASAQVKSAILLAGLYARGTTRVSEPAITRDHTERMLETMGAAVETGNGRISLDGGQVLRGCDVTVPGDLSSAAFLMLAAIVSHAGDVVIEGVGVNPTRTGIIEILRGMGAAIELQNERLLGREPVADIHVRASRLSGGRVDPSLVSLAIDEFPVLFVAAAAAAGTTEFSGLAELRVKESDRIATMANGLRSLGVAVEETADGARIEGGRIRGGTVNSYGDHRVAMSFAVAGTIADEPVMINDVAAVATSFPGFDKHVAALGGDIRVEATDTA